MPPPSRPISRASSFRSLSAFSEDPLQSPSERMLDRDLRSASLEARNMDFGVLTRRVSAQSLAPPTMPHTVSELSAKHFLQNTKKQITFALPPTPDGEEPTLPMSCSAQNVLYFSRGNRIYHKDLSQPDNINQFHRLPDKVGDLRLMKCGGIEQADHLAVATSKGVVQIFDVTARKIITTFTTKKGVSAISWNGSTLTVGSKKGTIRLYDIRATSSSKMKEQVKKMTRHQAPVTNIAWNNNAKLLATSDNSGVVYCWDHNDLKTPLDIGEPVQRRKKIQHAASVTVSPVSKRPVLY